MLNKANTHTQGLALSVRSALPEHGYVEPHAVEQGAVVVAGQHSLQSLVHLAQRLQQSRENVAHDAQRGHGLCGIKCMNTSTHK